MNPEGARLLTYSSIMPKVSPACAQIFITMLHRAPSCSRPGVRSTVVGLTAGHCTLTELRAMLWLSVTGIVCTPVVYDN